LATQPAEWFTPFAATPWSWFHFINQWMAQVPLRGLRKVTGGMNPRFWKCQAHGRAASKSWMRQEHRNRIQSVCF
jgi:hypothetical protein